MKPNIMWLLYDTMVIKKHVASFIRTRFPNTCSFWQQKCYACVSQSCCNCRTVTWHCGDTNCTFWQGLANHRQGRRGTRVLEFIERKVLLSTWSSKTISMICVCFRKAHARLLGVLGAPHLLLRAGCGRGRHGARQSLCPSAAENAMKNMLFGIIMPKTQWKIRVFDIIVMIYYYCY